jgi:hypothetical protein
MDDHQTAPEEESEVQYKPKDYFIDGKLLDEIDFIFEHAVEDCDKELEALKNVFTQNYMAAFFTASTLPVFAKRTAYNTGYMTMLGITITGTMFSDKSGNHIEKARERLKQTIEETEWGGKLDEMAKGLANHYLTNFINDQSGRESLCHIMNQCAVLIWSSFEILASDTFVSLLNRKPSLASALLNTESSKKYYREKDLAASLQEYNYDLSRHMGEALIQQRRLDDLIAIKNVYGVLLDKSEGLRNILNDDALWKLYKTRNLIVHRAGVVDALFLKETKNDTALGTKLRVTPSELKTFMILVGRAGVELIKAANDIFRDSLLQLNTQPNS